MQERRRILHDPSYTNTQPRSQELHRARAASHTHVQRPDTSVSPALKSKYRAGGSTERPEGIPRVQSHPYHALAAELSA